MRRLERIVPVPAPVSKPRLRIPGDDRPLMTEAEAREQGRLWIPDVDDRYGNEQEAIDA
jgi:hypothetical protein